MQNVDINSSLVYYKVYNIVADFLTAVVDPVPKGVILWKKYFILFPWLPY